MKSVKRTVSLSVCLMSLLYASTVHAVNIYRGNWSHGVRSTEVWQLQYVGEAWTNRAGHSPGIYYYRNGVYLGGARAYKDSWRRDAGIVRSSVRIWDTLNPWAPKTVVYYSL